MAGVNANEPARARSFFLLHPHLFVELINRYMTELIETYTQATKLAMNNNQTVGEENDYYITLKQLMDILNDIKTTWTLTPPHNN